LKKPNCHYPNPKEPSNLEHGKQTKTILPMEYPIHDIPESRTPLEKKNNRLNQTTKLSNKKNPKMLLNCR
jgi:hypothetical protein